MSLDILTEDFDSVGLFAAPPWTTIQGSGFTSDGVRAYPLTTGGVEDEEVLVQTITLSTPGPAIEYELDVTGPASWPTGAGQLWRQGLSFFKASSGRDGMTLSLERATTGPASTLKLTIRGATPAADVVVSSTPITALVLNQRYRLKVDITLNTTTAVILVYLDGTLTVANSVLLGTFNAATGRSFLSYQLNPLYPALWAKIDGAIVGYLDRLRVRDIGIAAFQPDTVPAYTLTAEPVLTPITVGAEDNYTSDAYPGTVPSPDRPTQPNDEYKHVETVFDSGHVITDAAQSVDRNHWPWTWATLTQAQRDALLTFYGTVKRVKAFTFTDSDTGETFHLKFIAPLETVMKDRGGASGGRIYSGSTMVMRVA